MATRPHRTRAFSPRPDQLAIGVAGLVLVGVFMAAAVREATPEWKRHQENVRRIVGERMGAAAAAKVPSGLRQTWIPELDRVDRCVTCHATIDWGAELAAAPNPARSHPPGFLDAHPVERFGCTLCHGGQGYAVETEAAHGAVAFWDEPLLDDVKAKRYGATAAELLETNCNVCHRRDPSVRGMPLLNEAKRFLADAKAQTPPKKCWRCHTIDGEGGTEGPDLSRVGEKHASHLVFPERWTKPRTALAWHVAHLLDPPAVSPGTAMTPIAMPDRTRLGLALLILSWREPNLPAAWIPRRK